MKLATYIRNNEARLGLVVENNLIDFNDAQPQVPSDLLSALADGVDLAAAAEKAVQANTIRVPVNELKFAPLIPAPSKVICLGLNYFDHAKEGGREKPDYPWFFFRGKTSLVAANEPAILPKVSERFDYEAELAVVIGQAVPRHVSQKDALDYVFGYSCFNDMSVRDYQKRTPQWTIGKNFDLTGGFGPYLVTADELPHGAKDLKIQCILNGQVMQSATTTDMIWSVAETISLLSECLTLEAGDVIVMGTPAGVGQSRQPPVWMKHGDTVEIVIEKIGTLTNPIQAEG
ncbi:fumarylacetoacetate hydrolase family protein [Acinetobacter sp. MB5]|uniref:fumarylacetoacetate hydrolase family protein n=1 Tax=Acinetobacter sp. MB5 TaxID=2069438 RepID=UPI000DCFE089|nr:fumarylacetoacetate hydrolase family protein [Acinetobacter sp. MB5]